MISKDTTRMYNLATIAPLGLATTYGLSSIFLQDYTVQNELATKMAYHGLECFVMAGLIVGMQVTHELIDVIYNIAKK